MVLDLDHDDDEVTRTGTGTVVVLGAGLAGLACARFLGERPYRLLEREQRPGGLAVTDELDGFLFDRGGHWLHLRDERASRLVEELLSGELLEVERKASIWSHGVLTPYPFQANTRGLPPETVKDCVLGFVEAWERRRRGGPRQPDSFEEFIHYHLGWGIARHFMVPYNRKMWGVPLRQLSASWCGRFVPRPSLEEVISGAVGHPVQGLGYNSRFVYPAHGGIGRLAEALAATLPRPAELGNPAREIDHRSRRVTTASGESVQYETLVSSIPLPALVDLLVDPPADVALARSRLQATTVICVNIGLRGSALFGQHWVYVPEPEYPFYRVGAYANAVPSLAPQGCTSLYVELALPPGRPAPERDELLGAVRAGLRTMGAIDEQAEILVEDVQLLPQAYVLFDHQRDEAVRTIEDFLRDEAGISCIGRHGRWVYGSMEDSLLDGMETGLVLAAMEPGGR